MKKLVVFFLSGVVFILGLASCSGRPGQAEKYGPKPISASMIAQDVYDMLQDEWDSYDSLSAEQKMLSSHSPGACYADFSDWASCEEFLGMPIPNPLEDANWLNKGTYAGMPEGFRDAPNVRASWFGTRAGHVDWIGVQSGYWDSEIRVALNAMMYGDHAEEKSGGSGCSVELARQSYIANPGDDSVLITEGSGERYVSRTAYLAQGHVLYCICVIGEPDLQDTVQETLKKVLSDFENT